MNLRIMLKLKDIKPMQLWDFLFAM